MNRQIITLLAISLALLGCASPTARFSSQIQSAKQKGQPLVVYEFDANHKSSSTKIFARIGFVNTSGRTIDRVGFEIEGYMNGHPAFNRTSKPVSTTLTAMGPIAPGSSQDMITPKPIWNGRSGSVVDCARLIAVNITFADGSHSTADTEVARSYLTPQINRNCVSAGMVLYSPRTSTPENF